MTSRPPAPADRLPPARAVSDRPPQPSSGGAAGPLLAAGQRVEFAGLAAGLGVLPGPGDPAPGPGHFGKADGLYTAGAAATRPEQLLAEMIPLAAQRGGGLTWEYYFHFDGGAPPWTSAMSQATGLEALGRAYRASGKPQLPHGGCPALPVFTAGRRGGSGPAPAGRASSSTPSRPAPHHQRLPADADRPARLTPQVSGNPAASALFAAGNKEAHGRGPAFNTGAWSLYQPGIEDNLSITGWSPAFSLGCAATPALRSTAGPPSTSRTT